MGLLAYPLPVLLPARRAGAGDRLGLVDEATGEPLPAAVLPYGGRSLLEGLVRDLQAREYVHFKLHGRQVTTPVAVMTSDAKGNHRRISGGCCRTQDTQRGHRPSSVAVAAASRSLALCAR